MSPVSTSRPSQTKAAQPFAFPPLLKSGLGTLDRVSPSLAAAAALRLFMHPSRRVPSPVEMAGLAAARPFSFDVDGQTLRGHDFGGRGPVTLLVHGWGSNAASMLGFVDPLRGRGYHVVTFDGPAHGQSPGYFTTMLGFASAIRALRERFGLPHAIIAHSIGAAASVLSLEDEDSSSIRLILVAPSCDPELPLEQMGAALGLSRATIDLARSKLAAEIRRPLHECSMSHTGRSCKAQTLVFHDRSDRLIAHSEGAQAAAALNARLITTEKLGHRRILSSKGIIDATCEFVCAPTRSAEGVPILAKL
jgi:pimeloyl-ACP methyl ester carboxylesterase